MTVTNVAQWRTEVLAASHIVQDEDETIPAEEAERRFLRFVELLGVVDGNEDEAVFQTLLECLRPQDDYGAYQTLLSALWRWPPDLRGQYAARHLQQLVELNPEMAGDVLANIGSDQVAARAFNAATASLQDAERRSLQAFIEQEEADGGWLDRSDLRGTLGSRSS